MTKIPDAKLMTLEELARIPKYHIERIIWSNYAGSFKYNKSKKSKKRFGQQKQTDSKANKITSNGLLMNRNHVEITGNEEEEENDDKEEKENGNPPKRFGYIFPDERTDEVNGEHYNKNNVLKNAMKDLNYTQKEIDVDNKFFKKDNGIKTDFTNAIFPLSKEKLNQTYDESEKNEERITVKKKTKKRKKARQDQEKTNKMEKDLMSDYDKVKLNRMINDEHEFKRDHDGKSSQEENRQNRNKIQDKRPKEGEGDEEEEKQKKKKKNLSKKKFGNKNYMEDSVEVTRYKKAYLDDKDIGKKPFHLEPSNNGEKGSNNGRKGLIMM